MRLLALLLATFLVVGCVGRDEPLAEAGASSSGARANAPDVVVDPTSMLDASAPPNAAGEVIAPLWQVGDAWAIRTSDGVSEEGAYLVVTQATLDSYTVATTSDQMAGYDAMFDVSYLGKIRLRDLAGAQGDQAVQYFSFPLTDGKTWTTPWDGFDVELKATKSARGFEIVGTREGEPYVEYDFVPELKWWSKLRFAEGYGFTVDRVQSGWSGEISLATAEVVFEGAPAAPAASPGSGAFTIAEGQSMAMITIHVAGMMWARTHKILDPSGMPFETPEAADFEVSDAGAAGPTGRFLQIELPPTPGEWHIVAPAAHDPEGGGFVTVHQVAVAKQPFSP